jgi:uncharacterized protein YjgD (DUF1641 family)
MKLDVAKIAGIIVALKAIAGILIALFMAFQTESTTQLLKDDQVMMQAHEQIKDEIEKTEALLESLKALKNPIPTPTPK